VAGGVTVSAVPSGYDVRMFFVPLDLLPPASSQTLQKSFPHSSVHRWYLYSY